MGELDMGHAMHRDRTELIRAGAGGHAVGKTYVDKVGLREHAPPVMNDFMLGSRHYAA